ncbi:phosphoribosylglycinamide formyltransferase, partial [Ceraceosorus guamensis]
MSVREVEEGIRTGLPEAGKQRSTSGKRICVLISGNGSNLQALIDATLLDRDELPNAQISLVVSNRKAAYGLQRAAGANPPIPTLVSALKTYQNKNPGATRDDYDEDLALKVMNAHEGLAPDLIVLAGFMHIVSPTFLRAFGHETNEAPGIVPAWAPARAVPIINLHPALPGAFDGAGAIERAYEAFKDGKVDKTGIMVHEVIAEVDRGAPVIVQEIPMRKGESLQELQERMHSVEHGLIVAGAKEILQ